MKNIPSTSRLRILALLSIFLIYKTFDYLIEGNETLALIYSSITVFYIIFVGWMFWAKHKVI